MMGSRITIGKRLDQGRGRDHQEDAIWTCEGSHPSLLRERGHLFIVADGVGGHRSGDVASQLAVEVISRAYYDHPMEDIEQGLRNSVSAANGRIYATAQESAATKEMSTTVVCAVIHGNRLYLAHVGDSRAYLLRRGLLSQLTEDHSWVNEKVRQGILSSEEARDHPRRHVITRSLGHRPAVEISISEPLALQDGDRVLLCSDGLYDDLTDLTIADEMGRDPQTACDRLVELANDAGGRDNISAVIFHLETDQRSINEETRPRPAVTDVDEDTAKRPAYQGDGGAAWMADLERNEELLQELLVRMGAAREKAAEKWAELTAQIEENPKKDVAPPLPSRWTFAVRYEHVPSQPPSFKQEYKVALPSGGEVRCGATASDWQDVGGERVPRTFCLWVLERGLGKPSWSGCLLVSPWHFGTHQRDVIKLARAQRMDHLLVVTGTGLGVSLETKSTQMRLSVDEAAFLAGNRFNVTGGSLFSRLAIGIEIEPRDARERGTA